MHRLFLPPEQFSDETAIIVGSDHLHLTRVLRARAGESVLLLDNRGNAFQAALVTIGKTETTARIEGRVELPPEPPVAITVAQALGKGDKFEQVCSTARRRAQARSCRCGPSGASRTSRQGESWSEWRGGSRSRRARRSSRGGRDSRRFPRR
jgi:hypothetical protein